MSDPLPSAPALRVAQMISAANLAACQEHGIYPGTEADREAYEKDIAQIIDRDCKIPELTAANAELLAALEPFAKAHAAMVLHGVPASAMFNAYELGTCYAHQFTMRQFSEAAALIAKHSPAKK